MQLFVWAVSKTVFQKGGWGIDVKLVSGTFTALGRWDYAMGPLNMQHQMYKILFNWLVAVWFSQGLFEPPRWRDQDCKLITSVTGMTPECLLKKVLKFGFKFEKKNDQLGLLMRIWNVWLLWRRYENVAFSWENLRSLIAKITKLSGQLMSVCSTHYNSPKKMENFPEGGGTAFPNREVMASCSHLAPSCSIAFHMHCVVFS